MGAGIYTSGAYSQVTGNRNVLLSSAEDDSALVTLTGLGEGVVPQITNQFSHQATVTLDAPSDPSAEFDIGNTGTFEPAPASFQLDSGASTEWAVSADIDPLPVEITVVHANGTAELTRDVVVPQAGQFDVIVNVASTGASGRLSFTAQNDGNREAVVTGIRIDSTSTDAVEVAENDIFSLVGSEYGPESPRQLVSDPLDVPASAITQFDNNDTVVIPDNLDELTFEFDRFMDPQGGGGPPHTDMRGETVWITLSFEDGSTRQFEIDDS